RRPPPGRRRRLLARPGRRPGDRLRTAPGRRPAPTAPARHTLQALGRAPGRARTDPGLEPAPATTRSTTATRPGGRTPPGPQPRRAHRRARPRGDQTTPP